MLTLLAGGSTNCLLDLGPINMPPTAEITAPAQSQSLYFEKVIFAAKITDADQKSDSLSVAWYIGADADCDKAVAGTPASCEMQRNDQCYFTPKVLGSICVVVRVTDRYGAKAEASRVFQVVDRPPTAVIEQTSPASTDSPLPLLSKLSFCGIHSTDPDPNDAAGLTYTWKVTQPDNTALVAKTCPSPDKPDTCSFTASMPGTYHVQLTVEDPNHMPSAPASVDVVIAEDQPPCITGTTPRSLQTLAFSTDTESFVVDSVADDVDPYPESTSGTFTWRYRIGTTGDFQRWQTGSNRLSVGPELFATALDLNEDLQIRVEYQDSVGHSLSSCDQNADRCELVPRSGCAQWVTWTVMVLP
jgi:hypothetical protein